uniref:Predicted protein n=1 Tax=Hordeum vulgare subsp. vulgare TaxID=112509 RepID=F2CQW8_HORVV|nr:predicted protein [Hordeum vulgare subsp. vulgare]
MAGRMGRPTTLAAVHVTIGAPGLGFGTIGPEMRLGDIHALYRVALSGHHLCHMAMAPSTPSDCPFFADMYCLTLGKLFVESLMLGSWKIFVCLRGVRRVAFAENNPRQSLYRVF